MHVANTLTEEPKLLSWSQGIGLEAPHEAFPLILPEFPFPQKELWYVHRIFAGVALFSHLRLLFPGMNFEDDHPLTCSLSMAKYEKNKIKQSKLVSLPRNTLKRIKSCMVW